MDTRDRDAAAGLLTILAGIALGALTAAGPLPLDRVAVNLSGEEARFWIAVTRLGDAWTRIVVGVALASWLALRGRGEAALALLSVCAVETVAVEWMKEAFARVRPDPARHLDQVTSLAFPSGHAAHPATLLLLGAAYLREGAARDMRIALWPTVALAVTLIGVSRVMLGVHWPSDVLGGWLIGAGFAAIGWALVPGRG